MLGVTDSVTCTDPRVRDGEVVASVVAEVLCDDDGVLEAEALIDVEVLPSLRVTFCDSELDDDADAVGDPEGSPEAVTE